MTNISRVSDDYNTPEVDEITFTTYKQSPLALWLRQEVKQDTEAATGGVL